MRITVVGNPGHRRVVGFTAAAVAAGLPPPRVVAWADVLRDAPEGGGGVPGAGAGAGEPQPDAAAHDAREGERRGDEVGGAGRRGAGAGVGAPGRDVRGGVACGVSVFGAGPVRLDSPGEDPVVHALLGGPADPHRVEGGAVRHAAFVAALRRVSQAVEASPGAWLANDPGEIAVMFDKSRAHALLDAAGVPVPPRVGPASGIRSYAELRAVMRESRRPRVFVKPLHGSSASGVVALETSGERVQATTSAELVRTADGTRLFNSLRVRKYRDEADVSALIDALCPDGVHVEAWLPKLTVGDLATDLRVLVVGGEATHVVARGSRSPMTNLHLGNARVDIASVRDAVGGREWAAAMATCVRAARCFPRTLHVGVDLLFGVDRRRHAVGEVNAFGDLLPGVLHRGRDTWGEQVRALVDGWCPPGPWRPVRRPGADEEQLPCPT
ncbi:STM4014 family protein [Yinghuangia sp. ASG 101]|uniref:STM4014 family protein n=1 Tax=Yinghuangia sp. ASG 101 TaxID=2896848 RepID=UPI001E6258FF|nr:STM4014 family protein [Yinghuangia sp. ASG 101]UGQ13295.1 STM4014 family protein [Yinghuangia sp. ASG 101]